MASKHNPLHPHSFASLSINTKSVHSGRIDDDVAFGVTTPVYLTTSTKYPNVEDKTFYPRYNSLPNQVVVSRKIADLEFAEDALLTSSGMSAITTVFFTFMSTGDHALFFKDIYRGTYGFVVDHFAQHGFTYSWYDSEDEIEKLIQPRTKIIYIETPSNPIMRVVDIEKIVSIAKKHKILTVIDNTFATPYNQHPFLLGVDVIIHSATKYLNGHSDLQAGAIVSTKDHVTHLKKTAKMHGGILNGMDCYLLERGLKTFGLRMEQHNKNALGLATYLSKHPRVKKVYYPGLESDPNHQVAKKQMKKGFSGMLSFELHGTMEDATRWASFTKVATQAVSLGGVETVFGLPAVWYLDLTPEERLKLGYTDTMVRLSVGIEDLEDLIQDFEQAFQAAFK